MKVLLPVVLLVIIAMLGGSLLYEIVQKHRIAKEWEQFVITESVRNYQDLDHGDVNSVKERLIALAKVEAEHYEKTYGYETGTKFAPKLSEAKEIYHEFQVTNSPSK